MKSHVVTALLLGCLVGCSSATAPPIVASSPGNAAGGSTPNMTPPCTPVSSGGSGGNGIFDATPDIGLGVGTLNPTTPPEGGTAFSGDATVSPATVDASVNPCPT